MKKIIFSTVILSTLLMYSCTKVGDNIPPYFPSFVTTYIAHSRMDLCYFPIENNTIKKGNEIKLNFFKYRGTILNGHTITEEESNIEDDNFICWNVNISPDVAILDRPYSAEIQARMDSICRAHGDITYEKKWLYYAASNYKSFALNIVSDKDFDASHPAGTSLNDIVNIRFSSAENFVKSSYNDTKSIYDNTTGSYAYSTETVPQFNSEKRKMIASCFYISLSKAPDDTSVHNLTLSYTLETGRTVTNTIKGLTIAK